MKLFKIAISCGLVGALLLKPPLASAETPLFSDDFSSGLSKWQPTRDDGSLWTISSGQAEATVVSGSRITELVPKDQYWNANWNNIEFEFDFNPLAGADRNISFGFKNIRNWYEFHFVGDSIHLARVKDGTVILNRHYLYTLNNGQTYRMKIQLDHGYLRLFIDGKKIVDEKDISFDGTYGKIALKVATGSIAPTRVKFDNIVVRSLDKVSDVNLNVPLFKQSDPLWKNQEYDSASKWASIATINRWGCAMTSMAMIMRHYGMNTLPDGQPLNPSTLNIWLKSQPDGYLSGNLNWVAATRLTKLISDKLKTPKLEYRRIAGSSLEVIKNEILTQKPGVLELAGHFIVGDGITSTGDVMIKDPAFTYSKFSQHQKPAISTRVFQPSQTDLSYLVMAHDQRLSAELRDENGELVEGWEGFTENITDHLEASGEHTPTVIQHQVAQPSEGSYFLTLSQPTFGPFSYQFFAYDQAGNPTELHEQGFVGSQPLTFNIKYSKSGASEVTQTNVTFASFRKDLLLMKNDEQFLKPFVYTLLDRLAMVNEKLPAKHQVTFLNVLSDQLQRHGEGIKPEAREYLTQQLRALQLSLKDAS